MRLLHFCGISLVTMVACASPAPAPPAAPAPERAGILVMAHGGSPEWNAAVAEAVAPLRERVPLAVAFGMADPTTLQAAVDSLEDRGVERVAEVRLFLSGESFLHQTEYLLGLRSDPPARPLLMRHGSGSERPHAGHGGAGADHGDRVDSADDEDGGAAHGVPGLTPVRTSVRFALQRPGLSDADVAARIPAARAAALAVDPSRESVVLLAHGMGDPAENDRLLANMDRAVEAVRAGGFRNVRAFALREDWPEARARAEAAIRAHVDARAAAGDRVLVVPFRLFGFGPYADVLDGLAHEAGTGLLPHPLVTRWIEETAADLLCPGGAGSARAGSASAGSAPRHP